MMFQRRELELMSMNLWILMQRPAALDHRDVCKQCYFTFSFSLLLVLVYVIIVDYISSSH